MSDVTTTRQEATMTESVLIRTYELFDISWVNHDEETGGTYKSRWTGYQSVDEAQAVVDYAATQGSGRVGTVERRTWDVIIPADMVDVYLPGCAERVETVEVG
jgi:hypothetical protein